ncbi:MAG: hypothetical protein ACK4M4_00680 [Flavobacterium sp.]
MTIKTISILTIICIANFAFGQTISNLKLDNKISILNDRAFFVFPTDAKNVARQGDIMSADPNTSKETRIILDIDKQRLVFFAKELFQTNNSNFLEVLSKENGEDFQNKILTEKDSIISVLSTPLKFDSTKNAILVNNLFVKTADNSIFVIGAYINPDAFKNKNEFQQLSEKVFSSFIKGDRKYNFKSRTEVLPIFDGKKNFKIELPNGFVVNKDKKYDFEVLKFQQVKDFSDTNWLSLTIYTGNHPSYFYGEYDLDESKSEKIKGQFLDQNVEWMYFKDSDKHFYLKEQKIPSDNIEEGLIVHIAMLSNQPKSIDELTKIIENIKVTNK